MNISNSITIGYWSTKGLGSVCRQIVLYSGYKLKAKNYKLRPIIKDNIIIYDASEWAENDKINLKKRNSLINLPYIELIDSNGNELLISQSNACLSYLGRKFKMFGANEIEQIQCEQLLLETNDLRNIISSFAYTHFKNQDLENEAANEVFTKIFQNTNAGKMQKFEHWFDTKENNKNYFLVNDITVADFNLFDILDFYIEFLKHYNLMEGKNDNDLLRILGYPNLSNFYQNFLNLPKMQKYYNSLFYKLPYTNKSANFGSGIKGNKWDAKNQFDETQKEIRIS